MMKTVEEEKKKQAELKKITEAESASNAAAASLDSASNDSADVVIVEQNRPRLEGKQQVDVDLVKRLRQQVRRIIVIVINNVCLCV